METERPQTPRHSDAIVTPTGQESPTPPSTNSDTSTAIADLDTSSISIYTASPSPDSHHDNPHPASLQKPSRILFGPCSSDPCLQCHLHGLKCSFSSHRQKPQRHTKGTSTSNREPTSGRRCSRCVRNGEPFCIRQEAGIACAGEWMTVYEAEGVEKEVVEIRVEELMWTKREVGRFALPRPGIWKREILRRVFEKGWEFEGWRGL